MPTRKTRYLGEFGYNDSPQELGEPAGFWKFKNYRVLWGAFVVSEGLNDAFETLGEPTYSRILTATDDDGYILFHLLMMSVRFISREREAEAIALAKAWLQAQGVDWHLPEAEWQDDDGESAPKIDLPF
jgi:hypothetical protein